MGDLVERLKGVAIQEAKTFGGDVEERTEWKAATRISSLEEENRRLREALRPFAAIKPCSFYAPDGKELEVYEVVLAVERLDFTGEDLRRAREAIGE